MTPSRRRLLLAAWAAGEGLASESRRCSAIEPISRIGKSHIRLSIAAYSYRQYLDLKVKPNPSMTLDDFIDAAAAMGLDAVELTQYYFPTTAPEYLPQLKGHCTRLGLDVSGTAVGNNFCRTDPAKTKEEIATVKEWVEHSSRLGAKTIRIFAGSLEKGDSEEQARARCIEAFQEACDFAGKFGIYLALENHGGITSNIDQMLALVKAIRHDWFGVNWIRAISVGNIPYPGLKCSALYSAPGRLKSASGSAT